MLSSYTKFWMCFFVATIRLSAVFGHGSVLTISPRDKIYVGYVNKSHMATCISPQQGMMSWTGPSGEKVPPGKGRIHTEDRVDKSKLLIFDSFEKRDNGTYTCSSLVDGKEEKAYFTLMVVKPISFPDTPTVQTATEGETFPVRCMVDGDPTITIVWQVNGVRLGGSGPKYNILADGLSVKNVSLSDGGEYQCRAFQSTPYTSTMADRKITLKIQHKPTWGKNATGTVDAYGYMTGVAYLTCDATAYPAATYEWFKDNKAIVQSKNVTVVNEVGRSTLQLVVHNKSVFHDYTCKATNTLGSTSQVFKLRETVKPAKPSHVSVNHANVESVVLNIKSPVDKLDIVGYSVQYMKMHKDHDKKWELGNTSELMKGNVYNVTGLEQDTSYLLRVASRNKAGVSDYTSAVTFKTLKHSNAATVTANLATPLESNAVTLLGLLIAAVHACFGHHL